MSIQQMFLGGQVAAFTPVTHTFASGSGTESFPAGATHLTIKLNGAGAGGGESNAAGGGGGGGAGYCESDNIAITGGQTLNWSLANPGIGAVVTGNPGTSASGNSAVSSGTLAITTMTAGPGLAGASGTAGGTGGAASGGTTANTPGGTGGTGAGAVNGTGGTCNGLHAPNPGAGGDGGMVGGGANGQAAQLQFIYT